MGREIWVTDLRCGILPSQPPQVLQHLGIHILEKITETTTHETEIPGDLI
jgi:hypothetical protein